VFKTNSVFKTNYHAQRLSEANHHRSLNHANSHGKNTCTVMLELFNSLTKGIHSHHTKNPMTSGW